MERRAVTKRRAAEEGRAVKEKRAAKERLAGTEGRAATERRAAFCSACDRNVPVLVEPPDWTDRTPSIRDATEAVVCLDYGVRCTGAMCPMFRAPTQPTEAESPPTGNEIRPPPPSPTPPPAPSRGRRPPDPAPAEGPAPPRA